MLTLEDMLLRACVLQRESDLRSNTVMFQRGEKEESSFGFHEHLFHECRWNQTGLV